LLYIISNSIGNKLIFLFSSWLLLDLQQQQLL